MTDTAPSARRGAWLYGPLIVLAALALWVAAAGLNRPLFFAINSLSRYTGTWLWANLTICGDGLVVAALFLPWIRRRPLVIWAMLIAALIGTVAVQVLKHTLDIPRPAGVLPPEQLIVIGPRYTRYAFPSGHSATIFTLAGVWIFSGIGKPWRLALLAFAALVALSRVAVGAHWPLDILAGAFIGYAAAWAGTELARRSPWGYGRSAQRLIGALLIIATAMLLLAYDTKYEQAIGLQFGIAVLALVVGVREYVRLVRGRKG